MFTYAGDRAHPFSPVRSDRRPADRVVGVVHHAIHAEPGVTQPGDERAGGSLQVVRREVLHTGHASANAFANVRLVPRHRPVAKRPVFPTATIASRKHVPGERPGLATASHVGFDTGVRRFGDTTERAQKQDRLDRRRRHHGIAILRRLTVHQPLVAVPLTVDFIEISRSGHRMPRTSPGRCAVKTLRANQVAVPGYRAAHSRSRARNSVAELVVHREPPSAPGLWRTIEAADRVIRHA